MELRREVFKTWDGLLEKSQSRYVRILSSGPIESETIPGLGFHTIASGCV